MRTTTATLKNASDATTIAHVPSRPHAPSGPVAMTRDLNATPTTTLGSANGIVTTARTKPRPRNRVR